MHLKIVCLEERRKELLSTGFHLHWPRRVPRSVNFPRFLGLLKYPSQAVSPHALIETWERNEEILADLKQDAFRHTSVYVIATAGVKVS